jgi:hypothetical protein
MIVTPNTIIKTVIENPVIDNTVLHEAYTYTKDDTVVEAIFDAGGNTWIVSINDTTCE